MTSFVGKICFLGSYCGFQLMFLFLGDVAGVPCGFTE